VQLGQFTGHKTTVASTNAMFCLSKIETVIGEQVRVVFNKTIIECTFRDTQPSSFSPEDHSDQSPSIGQKHSFGAVRSPEREIVAKLSESAKPLSVEELRAMLD
jgi:hypothetical protein